MLLSVCDHSVDMFNAILDTGNFPVQWLEGILIPIHKKNNPKDVKNYRGITLVSCFSKIFTSVLNNRIMKWAECYNIISDVQFGFRKNRSTIDAIFILNAIVNKVLKDKYPNFEVGLKCILMVNPYLLVCSYIK